MPVSQRDGVVVLDGHVGIDDVEDLVRMLDHGEGAAVDLSSCEHLHAAALVALVARGAPVAADATDPFLARWIAPLLTPPERTGR